MLGFHKLVIDRSKWRCGDNGYFSQGKLDTRLLDEDGLMCCLGQACLQLGKDKGVLLNKYSPACVLNEPSYMVTQLHDKYLDSYFSNKAMEINDNETLSRTGRELALYMLGKEHGIAIKFIGEYIENYKQV